MIGHNRSPFDDAQDAVDTVYTEAQNWLDGATVVNQAEADAVAKLLDMARKAKAAADAARKAEKQPHLDAGKAVDAKYKPLETRCDHIAKAAKDALQPFLAAQEAAKRKAEAASREAAEAAQKAAQEAFASAKSLEAREAAEAAAEAAKQADIAARVAAKDRGAAKGGARAVTLRRAQVAKVTDLKALLAWVWLNDRSALSGFADTYAAGAVRAGQTDMDGVTIETVETVA